MDAPDISLSLRLPAPYSLVQSLNHVGMGAADPTLVVCGHEACWGMQGPSGPASVYAHQRDQALDVKIWGADAAWLQPQMPALFGLQDNPSGFSPAHPHLKQLARRFNGMHLVKTPRLDGRVC